MRSARGSTASRAAPGARRTSTRIALLQSAERREFAHRDDAPAAIVPSRAPAAARSAAGQLGRRDRASAAPATSSILRRALAASRSRLGRPRRRLRVRLRFDESPEVAEGGLKPKSDADGPHPESADGYEPTREPVEASGSQPKDFPGFPQKRGPGRPRGPSQQATANSPPISYTAPATRISTRCRDRPSAAALPATPQLSEAVSRPAKRTRGDEEAAPATVRRKTDEKSCSNSSGAKGCSPTLPASDGGSVKAEPPSGCHASSDTLRRSSGTATPAAATPAQTAPPSATAYESESSPAPPGPREESRALRPDDGNVSARCTAGSRPVPAPSCGAPPAPERDSIGSPAAQARRVPNRSADEEVQGSTGSSDEVRRAVEGLAAEARRALEGLATESRYALELLALFGPNAERLVILQTWIRFGAFGPLAAAWLRLLEGTVAWGESKPLI